MAQHGTQHGQSANCTCVNNHITVQTVLHAGQGSAYMQASVVLTGVPFKLLLVLTSVSLELLK